MHNKTIITFLALSIAGCASISKETKEVEKTPIRVTSFSESKPEGLIPVGWQPWVLSKYKKPTEYQLIPYDGVTVIKANANSSASGLVHPLKLDPNKYPLLKWRWKVPTLITGADNFQRHTEDSPVRLVVTFAGDKSRLSFSDKLLFTEVKAFTGQELPYATLMYIWENRAPKGTIIPSLHTNRIQMIVADSGHENLGKWREEIRNVREDFRRAFGEEPGLVTSIGILTDTDNTGESVQAYYGDLGFLPIASY